MGPNGVQFKSIPASRACNYHAQHHLRDLLTRSPGHYWAQVAARRKPDLTPSQLDQRRAAIKLLTFDTRTTIHEIDADAPLPDGVLSIKKLIWARL